MEDLMQLLQTNSHEQKVQKILNDYNLNFRIEKTPLKVTHNNITYNSGYFGLVNSKTTEVLNAVRKGYRVTQNDEIVSLALKGAEKFGDLKPRFGGSINGGRKTFLQFTINGKSLIQGDTIERFITIIDSNDGTSRLSVGYGNITMSCKNQFHKFDQLGQSRFLHSESIDKKLEELPYLIEMSIKEEMRLMEIYAEFQSTAITKDLAHKLVNHLIGFDRTINAAEFKNLSSHAINKMNSVYDHINKEINDKGLNLWGLHSGVTSWTTHDKQAPLRANGRLESSMLGTNYKTNMQSLEFAMNQAQLVW